MCRAARKMDLAGKKVEEIVNYLEGVRAHVRVILTSRSLNLQR